MSDSANWSAVADAIAFAERAILEDPDPLNDREWADGQQYLMRILSAVAESSALSFDPGRPGFLPMLESVRYLGAAGPDIDYDVAPLIPGRRYRITGRRGSASYVGIAVYAHDGDRGASAIVDSVDVDSLVDADGRFTFEFCHAAAVRVIIRQYFHDRATQPGGEWSIEFVGDGIADSGPEVDPVGEVLPTPASVSARIANAAQSIRWNAQLNTLWTPERRQHPNEFVRQTADDIVAAIPNPDVVYSFSWWRCDENEMVLIEFTPPSTPYWSLQLCDRWFQCFPERRSNLNDRQVELEPDGRVRIALAPRDPGLPNWLSTSGHLIGTAFFRWLHADPPEVPVCSVVPMP